MGPEQQGSKTPESLDEWVHMARVRQTYLGQVLGTDEHGAGTFKLKLLGGHEWGSPLSENDIANYCEKYDCSNLVELYERAQTYFGIGR